MNYSIIIPVFNDPILPACLSSLAKQDKALGYEVIVVENSQTDWIKPLVESYGFIYTYEPITGSYQARNTGIRLARGTVLVFTDSDCEVAADWLTHVAKTMADPTIAGVMGFSAGAPTTRVAALEQLMYEQNIAKFTQQSNLTRVDTRNLALRKTVFDRVGYFMDGLQYGGDMEFGARAHQQHFNIVYREQMLVVHHNIKSARPLLQKRVRQNYGNMMILQLHDRDFVQTYFPHLLRYQASTLNYWRYQFYRMCLWPNRRLADTILKMLPIRSGYRYFKAVNVLAMRIGQLAFVLGKSV